MGHCDHVVVAVYPGYIAMGMQVCGVACITLEMFSRHNTLRHLCPTSDAMEISVTLKTAQDPDLGLKSSQSCDHNNKNSVDTGDSMFRCPPLQYLYVRGVCVCVCDSVYLYKQCFP